MPLQIVPVLGLPEISEGSDLAGALLSALHAQRTPPEDGDVLVVTHKIVAKHEGALVDLRGIEPSVMAREFGERWGKDPRQVEVVLRQSRRIVRMDRGVLIVETRHGLICANAGVDISNSRDRNTVCLLPEDPDRSARTIREVIKDRSGAEIAVIVCDTFGRPWREGLTNIAIGVSGMKALVDYVGQVDPNGYPLQVTKLAAADQLAGAAELVMGKLDRVPAALIRGYHFEQDAGSARDLLRRPDLDMFRY